MRLVVLSATILFLAPFGMAPDREPGGAVPAGFLLEDSALRELDAGAVADPPFPLGEKLSYSVRYYGVPIGSATIEVARFLELEGRRYAHLVATAGTNDFFSRFYRVADRHEAWVDLEHGAVVRTRTRTLHGEREAHEEAVFDWDTHFVLETEAKFHKRRRNVVAFDFGPWIYDVLDAFYALRAVPAEEGFEASFPVYASEKIYRFDVSVARKQSMAHPLLGPIETLEVRPTASVDGVSAGAGSGRVHVSADPAHVPVLLSGWFRASSSVSVGGMRAELTGYEPGDPAWAEASRSDWTPPLLVPTSEDGRVPDWSPPRAVVQARARSGVEPRDEREPWPPTPPEAHSSQAEAPAASD